MDIHGTNLLVSTSSINLLEAPFLERRADTITFVSMTILGLVLILVLYMIPHPLQFFLRMSGSFSCAR